MATAAANPKSAGLTIRAVANGDCVYRGGPFRPWMKIFRKGDTISSFLSEDGQNWQPLASEKVVMSEQVLIGLMVCSHNNGVLNKAMFDHVTLSPQP